MRYFGLTTLTTTGFGDITPVARSPADLEAVVGQLFLAVTVARFVPMELGHRCQ
jgi:hypothetical protein